MNNSLINTNENKIINKKNLLYLRIISLFFVYMAVPAAFIMNYYGLFSYVPGYNHHLSESGWKAIANQLVYFTVWSNILSFFWVILATVSSIFEDNEKLANFVEYPGVKNTPLIMMFITMSVSFLILYPAFFYSELQHLSLLESFKSVLITAFLTPLLFQHLLVAVVLIIDMIFTNGYKTINNEKETKSQLLTGLLIASIIPIIWLILSIIGIATQTLVPQYPFMNLFPHVLLPDGSISEFSVGILIINWITLIGIILVWFGYYLLLFLYSNKKYKTKYL